VEKTIVEKMKKYKIIVAYDGTEYRGWQMQDDVPSIAKKMQDIFVFVFNKKIILRGASRTDAGVHALGQVATFTVDCDIPIGKIFYAWNNMLPPEIMIRSIDVVPKNFSVHKNVDQKTYVYHFFNERPLPFVQMYGWYLRYPVDIQKLQSALQVFVGTHDFRSFCTGDEYEDTVRHIDLITMERIKRYNIYRIIVKGRSFLRYMIRRIVGASIEVASRDNLKISYLKEALKEKDPEQTLPNAPAKGLVLYKIKYKSGERK